MLRRAGGIDSLESNPMGSLKFKNSVQDPKSSGTDSRICIKTFMDPEGW